MDIKTDAEKYDGDKGNHERRPEEESSPSPATSNPNSPNRANLVVIQEPEEATNARRREGYALKNVSCIAGASIGIDIFALVISWGAFYFFYIVQIIEEREMETTLLTQLGLSFTGLVASLVFVHSIIDCVLCSKWRNIQYGDLCAFSLYIVVALIFIFLQIPALILQSLAAGRPLPKDLKFDICTEPEYLYTAKNGSTIEKRSCSSANELYDSFYGWNIMAIIIGFFLLPLRCYFIYIALSARKNAGVYVGGDGGGETREYRRENLEIPFRPIFITSPLIV